MRRSYTSSGNLSSVMNEYQRSKADMSLINLEYPRNNEIDILNEIHNLELADRNFIHTEIARNVNQTNLHNEHVLETLGILDNRIIEVNNRIEELHETVNVIGTTHA